MKIHRPTVQMVLLCLHSIFAEGRYADKVLEYYFRKNRKLGSRDRRWIAEAVYDIVRWWRKLWFVLDRPTSTQEEDLLLIFHVWLWSRQISQEVLPEDLRRDLDEERMKDLWAQAEAVRALRESLPDWLDELASRELSVQWDLYASALNQQAPVTLRVNTVRTSSEELQQKLQQEEIQVSPIAPHTLQLKERANVFRTESFRQGLFEVQDMSSQKVAPLLEVEPGMRVIDACAGAGGKSLHLAALMKNRGKVLALDVAERKLEALKLRARRNGYSCIETRSISSRKVIKRLKESADRLLLDVPCTGLGVLRRNPDTKWKLTPEECERLSTLQVEILRDYSGMLKPGGLLVYSTCSVLPSENGHQVKKFLNENEGWSLYREEVIAPGEDSGDGFYAAVLRRDGNH